uniref:Protein kinase domain-containing protein n=1 Tax=Kalanchoe fedtschenkoi TaxID=63787 RepID=A0A7N0TT83_KALFE
MAFDQNSVPMDLRPINVARVDPRIMHATANRRNIDGFPANPTPFYYPVATAEPGGFLGEVFGNPSQLIPNSYPPGPSNPAFTCTSTSSGANMLNQGCNYDPSTSGKRPKFLCSFGGKILPRPGSGVLRYVGGHTRLIGFKGDINFDSLAVKMVETCGQPVAIKYQLPGEDLDALVSIASHEDFDIMMEEYDKIISNLPDGSAKLRLYLFSTSDAYSSGLSILNGLSDTGQKYFEAINGILDEAGGVVTRKESLDTAASTQNSDLGGNEALDCSGQAGQRNAVGPQTTGASSCVGNSGGMSPENTTRAVALEPLSSNAAAASALRLGIPAVTSSVQISNDELDLEKPFLPTMSHHMIFETKQLLPTCTPYMHACVPRRQDIQCHGDSIQFPHQIGFRQPPTVGTPGSLFQQHQLFENAVSAGPKPFMPAMTTSGTPQVVLRPNAVQQMMYPSRVRRDSYPEGVAYPVRMVPLDPSYYSYQPQVPHSIVGGAYGWNISTPNHTVFHEGPPSPQQVLYTSNVTRLDDCYMCQKALPHAHSDSIAQQLKDGIESPTSDSNRSYHSLQSEVNVQTLPSNIAWTTGGSREVFDEQSSGAQSRALNQADNQAVIPLLPFGVPQSFDTRPENERTALLVTENLNRLKLPVSQGVLLSSGCTSYNAPINNLLPCLDVNIQQYSDPTQFQAQKNALVNMPSYSVVLPTAGMPSQTPDHLSRESPRETLGKSPGAVPKDDMLGLSADNRRQPNQSTEACRVCSPEHVINAESDKFDGPLNSDMLDKKPQQYAGRDVYVDGIFSQPNVGFDSNLVRPTEALPCSSSEVPYSTSQATESYSMPLQPITGYAVERPSVISAWKDGASQLQLMEPVTSNGHAPSFIMPPKTTDNIIQVQDTNSFFSHQDPSSARQEQDITLPPPKPTTVKNESEIQPSLAIAFLKNSNEVNMEQCLEDSIRLPSGNIITDPNFQRGPSEENAKQELQAVAECEAAPPSSLHTDLSSDGAKELSKAKQERAEWNNDSESQYPKLEAKLPENTSLGFPTSDLGRLQIINNNDLEELRELGSGTFGTVYHGKWRGTDVAIKRINNRCFQGKPSEQERMKDDFWNEAINLADLHHPNVVAFYGVVFDGPGGSVATVTEYMVNGSLRNALQKNERSLDKRKRIAIAMDVAFGMEYLHGKNIVHFDLKSDNLLVNLRDSHRPICKVGDLGLSKVKCHTLISGGVRGTLPWMAPELLNGSSSLVSEKVDVFSYGIVLWELITGEEPYADLHYGAIIGGIVSNTLRPSIPESCDPEWRSLMERCWSSDPSERPSFTEIANQLRVMAIKVPFKRQPPLQK